MTYKVLDKNLLPVGDLILENNMGATNFWGDQVTRQLAQDDSNQDPATTMSMTVNSTDAKANNKLWNHTLSLSFDNTEDVGSKVVAQDSYLLYQDEQTGRWYLMNVYQSDEYENYRTAQAQNSAIIELSKIYTTGKIFTQVRLKDVVNYVFSFVPWSAQIADDSSIIIDSYTIDKGTSVQAIIQDLQVKFEVDVDAFVEMDNNGRINNRVISFEHVGHNNGAKIWYGSAVKGAESIRRTGISSTLYTKFYIKGVTKEGDNDSGSIISVNAGKDYIVDDEANELYNPIGASSDVPTYLEVRLENTLLSEPTALLSWGNKIVELFNHPRFNYVVTSMHDADYGLGDTVVVNDSSKKPALVISSRVIQIVTSQASPETNTITLGEFSNLFTVKNEQATTILTLKKDINIVQIAADNAVNRAKLAHDQAVEAQSKAITAQATADGKATAFTVSSLDDLPAIAKEGDIAWVNNADGTYGYTYIKGKWVEDINPHLKQQITDGVNTSIQTAKQNTDKAVADNNKLINKTINDVSIQQANNEINKRNFESKAQAMADKSLSDAKADNQTVASQTLASANSNLATAKSQIENGYKSADGVINKKVDDTATTIGNTITQNKRLADNGISTAQSTAQQAVDGLEAKVSQSEYDGKTKDLTTKVGSAQLTADNATTTIGNYQKSNDGRVKATETAIDQNANDIQLRATKQDLNNATGNLNTAIGKVDVRAGQVESSVSELSNTVNSMGQINQLMNTEFNPDLSNWAFNNTNSNNPYRGYVDKNAGATTVGFNTLNASDNSFARFIQLIPVSAFASSASISVSWQAYTTDIAFYNNLWIYFLDSSGATINKTNRQWTNLRADGTMVAKSWERQKWENISIPDGTTTVRVSFEAREGTRAYLVRPMVVFSDTIGSYTAGNYNNNDKITLQQLTIDGITQTVSSQGSNINSITKRVQTAEGTLSTATDNISGLSSKTNQMAGQFNQEISDRKNGDSNTLSSAQNYTTSQIQGYDSGLQTQLTQTSSAFLATVSASNLVLDSSLTDSAFSGSIVNWIPSGAGKWYYSSGVSYQGVQSMGYNQNSLDGDYSFVDSQPWGINSFSGSTLNVSVDVRANNIGGTSTDYLIVILMEQDNNGNQTQRTEVTGYIRNTNNNWVNYRKKITINPNSKKFFIRYQMRGNGNVYIARPYVGVQELIDGGYTAGTNNNNQTILSLFKDSWSIGIADNIGKITSGIVGDTNSLSLISKNVTIDSPQTQINGKAWIKSADIANGAIGNAQIGDASITSAKIANLDASKISGGTISGIDFNVNRRMTIASGGIIHSDVMDITKDAFNLLGMMNNTKTFVTAYNTQVSFANAVYGIDSSSGEIHSSGKITAIAQDGTKGQADFTSSYSNDHLMFSTVNWTDGSKDNFVHITDANITILSGADSADTATDYSNISPVRIRTTGDMIAGSSITSGNIQLNSYHAIISQDGLPLYVTGNGGNPVDFNVNQLTANNIVLNAAHSIISKDNGKMYFYGGNGKQVDLGVKSLTQSSLVSLKENIAEVDEFDLLHKTISADLNRYNFIGDNDKYTHVTPMIDDVNGKKYIPKEWVSEDGRSVDTYTIIGYLVGSVKALQKQINKLEQG
ncbi:hypothetical protein Q5R05_07965 [Leuconostoc carnosum]|uniref:hypothetical protein n=1 Tax=Leuconostoc carnosum TaxID=1252 RepID=UPI00272EA47C|nr:hypothetical protein [Leuconostoc carnosum]WLC97583.1 hypothetical protein Q5R05_07965 [Leuconostoc carnosum]